MRIEVEGEALFGRAVDLSERPVSPEAIAEAIRRGPESPVVDCPEPGPAHEYVGVIEPGMSLRTRPASAAVARSLGTSAPQDDEIAALATELDSIDVTDVSLRAERRRAADVGGSETELRERVAALRGRVRTLREAGDDSTDAESKLRETTRRLSEAETDRIAAEQALERARANRRSTRDRRERRLRLRDRKENLERDARRYLSREVHESFVAAVDAVPGRGRVPEPGAFEGDAVTAALALARIAALDAPVVLACDRFETPESAAECLDAAVLQV